MVWCVRGFWSCLCCCLSNVLCRAPGACAWGGAWGLHGCGHMCWVGSTESEQRSPPRAALPWELKCGGDNFLSPVVLCRALPQGRLDLSSASPTGKHWALQGRALSSPALDLSVAPVHGSCLHWGGDQPPSLPEQRVLCVWCQEGVTEPWASWVLLHLPVWRGVRQKSVCGSPNGAPEQAALNQAVAKAGWKSSWLLKPSWGFAVGLRPNPEEIEKNVFPCQGEAGMLRHQGRGGILLWVTQSQLWVCLGNWGLWEALKAAQSSQEAGKEREGCTACGQHCQAGRSCGCFSGYSDSLV